MVVLGESLHSNRSRLRRGPRLRIPGCSCRDSTHDEERMYQTIDVFSLRRERDLATRSGRARQEGTKRAEHLTKVLVVSGYHALERVETLGDLRVTERILTKTYEGADHENAHLDRARAVQHRGSHQGTMLA